MKLRIPLLLALASAFAFTAVSSPAAESAPAPALLAPGTLAPDFTAFTADQKPVKLTDYRGKIVLVDFWATWCGPCLKSMPHLEQLHRALGAKNFVVLGVCVADTQEKFDGWMKSPRVPTTYLKLFDRAGRSRSSIALSSYSTSVIPTFYLIDKEGRVVHAASGFSPETEAALDAALAKVGLKR